MIFLAELGPAEATVIGAMVGAFSGISGGLLTIWLQLRLERLKWPKTREDALVADLRQSVHQFSLKMSAAGHSMCWLTWLAENRAKSINAERIDNYDKELHMLLPEISGLLTSIAALDRGVFDRLNPLADEIYALDARIGSAGLSIHKSPEAAAEALAACYDDAVAFERSLGLRIADIVSERISQRARQLEGTTSFSRIFGS